MGKPPNGGDTGRAEEKKRADRIHMSEIQAEAEEKKRVNEIKLQMAKTEDDKELTLKESELKVQDQASTSAAADPPPRYRDANSTKLPAFIDKKDEL